MFHLQCLCHCGSRYNRPSNSVLQAPFACCLDIRLPKAQIVDQVLICNHSFCYLPHDSAPMCNLPASLIPYCSVVSTLLICDLCDHHLFPRYLWVYTASRVTMGLPWSLSLVHNSCTYDNSTLRKDGADEEKGTQSKRTRGPPLLARSPRSATDQALIPKHRGAPGLSDIIAAFTFAAFLVPDLSLVPKVCIYICTYRAGIWPCGRGFPSQIATGLH